MSKDKNNETKRAFYAEKLAEAYDQIQNKQLFEAWSAYELSEKAQLLKANYEKYEAKCMATRWEEEVDGNERKAIAEESTRMETLYIRTKALIQGRIDLLKQTPTHSLSDNDATKHVEMPKRNKKPLYTHYSGSLNEWFSFSDALKTVDNSTQSDEEKMIDFVQMCSPEFLAALNADGFGNAKKKLKERYENKCKLAAFYTRKLESIERIDTPSAQSLQSFVDKVDSIKQAFERIGQIETQEFIALMLASKLPGETARAWERHRKTLAMSWAQSESKDANDHMPSLDALQTFLQDEQQIYASEMIEAQSLARNIAIEAGCNVGASTSTQSPDAQVSNAKVHAAPQAQRSMNSDAQNSNNAHKGGCPLCEPPSFHPLYKCTKFLALDIEGRILVVSKFKLCIRCLQNDHMGPCMDKRSNQPCPRCKPEIVYHNSAICPKNTFISAPIVKRIVVTSNNNDNENWSD